MPDGLHPNAAGMELMAKCLEPRIAQLMGQPVTDFSAARGLLDGQALQSTSYASNIAVDARDRSTA